MILVISFSILNILLHLHSWLFEECISFWFWTICSCWWMTFGDLFCGWFWLDFFFPILIFVILYVSFGDGLLNNVSGCCLLWIGMFWDLFSSLQWALMVSMRNDPQWSPTLPNASQMRPSLVSKEYSIISRLQTSWITATKLWIQTSWIEPFIRIICSDAALTFWSLGVTSFTIVRISSAQLDKPFFSFRGPLAATDDEH